MTLKEAALARHTVRRYIDRPISPQIVSLIDNRIKENNEKFNLNMKLVTENGDAFNSLISLFLAKGVRNYIILAAEDTPAANEHVGYCGADIMLYAQILGLNTWWVGATFSKKGAKKNIDIKENEKIIGVIAVGYGAEQGIPHKSKAAHEIASYAAPVPEWFSDGVNAVLLAPTALNKQAFKIVGDGNKVSITCDNGNFSQVDLGIGKYFFEVGAGKENFLWI